MKKVLVVEDDQFLSNAYKLKLSKSGFDVSVASDGEIGIKLMKEDKPDIVLLDLIMPNVDGFTCLESIKADDSLKDVPVIVASNLGQDEDVERAKSLGAVDFIIKSNISIEEIVEKVKAVVGS